MAARAAIALVRGVPLALGMMITNRCNLRCAYCSIPDDPGEEMSTLEVFETLGQFARLGTVRLGLSGGEPLVREDLPAIVRYARDSGMYVTINTNASLLAERAEELDGVDLIVVSINGTQSVHDELRGEGSFDAAMEGIEAAKKRGLKVVTLAVLSRKNLHSLQEMFELIRRMGLKMYVHPITECEISGELGPELLPDVDEFRAAVRDMIERRDDLPLASSTPYLQHMLNYPDYSSWRGCKAGRGFVYMTPDGCIAPCHVVMPAGLPSVLTLGAKNAMAKLPKVSCDGCCIVPMVELSLIISGHWQAVKQAFRVSG